MTCKADKSGVKWQRLLSSALTSMNAFVQDCHLGFSTHMPLAWRSAKPQEYALFQNSNLEAYKSLASFKVTGRFVSLRMIMMVDITIVFPTCDVSYGVLTSASSAASNAYVIHALTHTRMHT